MAFGEFPLLKANLQWLYKTLELKRRFLTKDHLVLDIMDYINYDSKKC